MLPWMLGQIRTKESRQKQGWRGSWPQRSSRPYGWPVWRTCPRRQRWTLRWAIRSR